MRHSFISLRALLRAFVARTALTALIVLSDSTLLRTIVLSYCPACASYLTPYYPAAPPPPSYPSYLTQAQDGRTQEQLGRPLHWRR
jgi:hypothetical protein